MSAFAHETHYDPYSEQMGLFSYVDKCCCKNYFYNQGEAICFEKSNLLHENWRRKTSTSSKEVAFHRGDSQKLIIFMIQRPEDFVSNFDKEAIRYTRKEHDEQLPKILVFEAHSLIVPTPVCCRKQTFLCDARLFKPSSHSNQKFVVFN